MPPPPAKVEKRPLESDDVGDHVPSKRQAAIDGSCDLTQGTRVESNGNVTESASITCVTGAQEDISAMLGYAAGCKLEVKWDLVSEASGESTPRWWGCSLVETAGTHALEDDEVDEEPEICTVWEVLYDENPPDFLEKETAKVCFLSDHMLYDIGEDATFCFRTRGSDWDEEDEPLPTVSEGQEDGEDGSEEVTEDVAAPDARQLVDGLLTSLLAKHGEKMARLPYAQQSFVASVVEQSKSRLTERLEAAIEEKKAAGLPSVISEEDMASLLEGVSSELESIKNAAASELAGPTGA